MTAKRLLAAMCLLMLGSASASASGILAFPGGGRANVKMRTVIDLRFKQVVRQTQDLSCGAAAVATLINFYYGETVTEGQVIEAALKVGNAEKIKKDGFSMLELKRYGEKKGYVVRGFRVKSVNNLPKIKIPVLTLINTRGYSHFVILKGVRDGKVYVADPAFGNRNFDIADFAKSWRKVILVFLSPSKKAQSQFKLEPQLRAPVASLRYLLDRSLGTIRPGTGEF